MTDSKLLNTDGRNFRAAGYLLAAVLVYSFTPVLLHVGEAHQSPFMYNAVRTLATCLGLFLFLTVFYHRLLFNADVWRAIGSNFMRWSLFGIFVGSFTGAVMGWSLKYIDISAATVLYETWPLWVILLTGRMFKGENRYADIGVFGWICILIGFVGLTFVILSQSEDVALLESDAGFFIGVGCALSAAVMIALIIGCSIGWSNTVLKEFSPSEKQHGNGGTQLFFAIIGIIVASTPGIIIGALWGIGDRRNEIVEFNNMSIAFFHGFFVVAVERILFRLANIISTRLEINALAYMTPIFSLVWLAMLGYINVPHSDWLVVGATGVVAVNILLNFKAEKRLAYQSLVVSLWVCGVIVYFRPILPAPVFYDAVVLAATMFILILSFRVDRLVRRTSDEDNMTIEIWRKISLLAGGEKLQKLLRGIDEASSPKKLGEAHSAFVGALKSATDKISEGGKELFADIMESVNKLAHSKQQGANFGEQVVLCILGGITAVGLLFFMPEDVNEKSGAGGFFLETAAFLAAATVIFLLFNIQDLQYDRRRQMFRTKTDGEKDKPEGIVFREDQDRAGEKIISIICCLGIVITFGALLWFKWVP